VEKVRKLCVFTLTVPQMRRILHTILLIGDKNGVTVIASVDSLFTLEAVKRCGYEKLTVNTQRIFCITGHFSIASCK
jgi:hypothetical protein